jgi:hypothetical protein
VLLWKAYNTTEILELSITLRSGRTPVLPIKGCQSLKSKTKSLTYLISTKIKTGALISVCKITRGIIIQ